MRLSRNMHSMKIYETYQKNLNKQSKAYGSISSGLKVQTYRDDPNAKAKSDKLKLEIRGLEMASRNIQDSVSLMQTADGGMQNISESIQRARELMVQAGGANTDQDKAVIQNEIDTLLNHVTDTANNTEMNGVKMLAKEGDINLLIGISREDVVTIPTYNLSSEGLGLGTAGVAGRISTMNVDDGLIRLDVAIEKVNAARSKYGALGNRMESTYETATSLAAKVQDAEANITGTDIALEMVEYSKNSILVESGMAMMVQTNKIPQDVLRILENIRRP